MIKLRMNEIQCLLCKDNKEAYIVKVFKKYGKILINPLDKTEKMPL
jgi:hypothetical protein